MKLKPKQNSNLGFSIVELMIVVAIIGLLTAVGVPQYEKMQARARTAEAKMALSTVYSSEQAFKAEWNQFTIDLENIGAAVTGSNLRYVAGFRVGFNCTGYVTDPAPGEDANANNWTDGPVNSGNLPATFMNVSNIGDRVPASIGMATSCDAQLGFEANAHGDPRNSQIAADLGVNDSWSIDQSKSIKHIKIGY